MGTHVHVCRGSVMISTCVWICEHIYYCGYSSWYVLHMKVNQWFVVSCVFFSVSGDDGPTFLQAGYSFLSLRLDIGSSFTRGQRTRDSIWASSSSYTLFPKLHQSSWCWLVSTFSTFLKVIFSPDLSHDLAFMVIFKISPWAFVPWINSSWWWGDYLLCMCVFRK